MTCGRRAPVDHGIAAGKVATEYWDAPRRSGTAHVLLEDRIVEVRDRLSRDNHRIVWRGTRSIKLVHARCCQGFSNLLHLLGDVRIRRRARLTKGLVAGDQGSQPVVRDPRQDALVVGDIACFARIRITAGTGGGVIVSLVARLAIGPLLWRIPTALPVAGQAKGVSSRERIPADIGIVIFSACHFSRLEDCQVFHQQAC